MIRSFLIGLSLITGTVASEPLSIYATSNLFYAIDELNADFARLHPRAKITVTLESTEKITTKIIRGGECDLFLCADLEHPRDLVRAGMASADSLTVFAIGKLAVWTKRTDLYLSDLAALTRNPQVKRIAITNAEIGPYARASRQVMIRAGAWQHALPKVVVAETIIEVSQMVARGEADIGFISLSLALSPKLRDIGRYREITLDPVTPLIQAAVLTKDGQKNRTARNYLTYLRSPQARKILERCGYGLPES